MVCITHLELCPYCKRIALMVCEYDEPYPRVEAECQCCGYKAYDVPMRLTPEGSTHILILSTLKGSSEATFGNGGI